MLDRHLSYRSGYSEAQHATSSGTLGLSSIMCDNYQPRQKSQVELVKDCYKVSTIYLSMAEEWFFAGDQSRARGIGAIAIQWRLMAQQIEGLTIASPLKN